jgi:hypothetical protein
LNVYVETNFVLELALEQEEASSCEALVQLAEKGTVQLIVPAYSFVEPHETLRRRHSERMRLAQEARAHARQLSRSSRYRASFSRLREIDQVFRESTAVEESAFEAVRIRLAACTRVLPLTSEVLDRASAARLDHELAGQDSVVFASVCMDLEAAEDQPMSCFITRNANDFDNPSVQKALRNLNCRLISNFADGRSFVSSELARASSADA